MCRKEKKEGVCPKVLRTDSECGRSDECSTDSDCIGDKKCCYNECGGKSCLPVVKDFTDEENDGKVEAIDPNSPKITVDKPFIVSPEGSVATLTVYVQGSPRPDVYWRRRGQPYLDTRVGKYQITRGGSLKVKFKLKILSLLS